MNKQKAERKKGKIIRKNRSPVRETVFDSKNGKTERNRSDDEKRTSEREKVEENAAAQIIYLWRWIRSIWPLAIRNSHSGQRSMRKIGPKLPHEWHFHHFHSFAYAHIQLAPK